MIFYPISQLVVVLPNKYNNYTIVKFALRGISARINIRNSSDEDLDTLPVYDITSPLFGEPTSKFHDKKEEAMLQVAGIKKVQRAFVIR